MSNAKGIDWGKFLSRHYKPGRKSLRDRILEPATPDEREDLLRREKEFVESLVGGDK